MPTASTAENANVEAVIIWELLENTHRALKMPAIRPDERVLLGSAMAERSRRLGLTNADIACLENANETRPAEPLVFD